MTSAQLAERLRAVVGESLPGPAAGHTRHRHRRLFEVGREDLTLAKLAEAHWDAVAILAEAGREPAPGALYAVWASDAPAHALRLTSHDSVLRLNGSKAFSSGVDLVDRALITVNDPEQQLVEVDLRLEPSRVHFDLSAWQTDAFRLTHTGAIHFDHLPLAPGACVGPSGWYLTRPGFWHGACGPAACWAGGAAALLDIALASSRADAHTTVHLAAMHADVWLMTAALDAAAAEMDAHPADAAAAHIRALTTRHVIEQACSDTLRRFARALGPAPLSMNPDATRRYHELDLYLRQSHAERDLEALGHALRTQVAPVS